MTWLLAHKTCIRDKWRKTPSPWDGFFQWSAILRAGQVQADSVASPAPCRLLTWAGIFASSAPFVYNSSPSYLPDLHRPWALDSVSMSSSSFTKELLPTFLNVGNKTTTEGVRPANYPQVEGSLCVFPSSGGEIRGRELKTPLPSSMKKQKQILPAPVFLWVMGAVWPQPASVQI